MRLDKWREDALKSLEYCNNELARMHIVLHEMDKNFSIDMTRSECMDRIIKIQETLLEATRRLCGLEY